MTATQDENGDGVVDRRDDTIAARRYDATGTTTMPAIGRDGTEVVPAYTPRPRASMLATLSLIVGVVAVLAVLSGRLAGAGVVLGVLAALLAFGGIAATGRRYVAGKGDALLGLLAALAALVLGVLCLTGSLSWLTTSTNQLSNVHDWLQAHASWLLLNRG